MKNQLKKKEQKIAKKQNWIAKIQQASQKPKKLSIQNMTDLIESLPTIHADDTTFGNDILPTGSVKSELQIPAVPKSVSQKKKKHVGYSYCFGVNGL